MAGISISKPLTLAIVPVSLKKKSFCAERKPKSLAWLILISEPVNLGPSPFSHFLVVLSNH